MSFKKPQIYNANKNLKAAGVQIQFTPDQVKEYIKCAQDPVYFIDKYAKIVSLDKGVVSFKMYPYQRRIIEAIHNNKNVLGKLFRQAGKALPIDTVIATEFGLKPIKDVHVGDKVFGPDGKLTTVTAESEEHLVNMFKITFDNGDEVVSCEDHQWTVYDRYHKHTKSVQTTKELYNSTWRRKNKRGYYEYSYYIPNTQPVEYSEKNVKIDPYMLGAWLGDGSSEGNSFTVHLDHKDFFEKQGVVLVNRSSSKGKTTVTERIENLTLNELRYYNLLKNKHIPDDYKYGSVDQRVSLLQGLMDTDGFINSRSSTCHIQLCRKYDKLIEDLYQLLCSLGIKVTKKYFDKTNSIRYSFSCPRDKFDVFRIPHKLERQKQTNTQYRYINSRTIQNIEPLNQQMGKCIQVDNIDNMYLCGREYIPTHNSTIVAAYFTWYILFNDNKTVVMLGNKQAVAIEIFGRVQFMIENLPQWLQQGIVEWNKKSLVLENGSRCIAAATSASAVRGFSVNLLLLDEFAHLKPNLAEEFIASVFPTISSAQTSKLIIISTPNGLNHYYKLWKDATNGVNDFKTVEGRWQENPDRSQKWADEQLGKLGPVKYRQEIECIGGESLVTIRDKETGDIMNISIEDLYEML